MVVDSYRDDDAYTRIGISAHAIVVAALEYLIACGHRDIGIVATGFIPDLKQQVRAAVTEILERHAIPLWEQWYRDMACNEETAVLCAQEMMSASEQPTAIFCTSDIYALGVMGYLKKQGTRVPDDLSIIGADNIVTGKYTEPALTTVDYDKRMLGKKACDMLISRINGQRIENLRLQSLDVTVRNSVKVLH